MDLTGASTSSAEYYVDVTKKGEFLFHNNEFVTQIAKYSLAERQLEELASHRANRREERQIRDPRLVGKRRPSDCGAGPVLQETAEVLGKRMKR